MEISVKTGGGKYAITVERGALLRAGEIFGLKRRAFIVTDSGVPRKYPEAVAAQCESAYIFTLPQGEAHKNAEGLLAALSRMAEEGFTRKDCVIACGGGVPGDLAGFAAATYMRGIDFYNIPTTLLSQVDSSIGGKTAVDLDGYKNIIGAYHQPKGVIIDGDALETLPGRQLNAGLCEALKMAVTHDPELFEIFEKGDPAARIDEITVRALKIKKSVVEKDERESGLRRVLNFGHTLGHAFERESGFELLHGECVALGMIPMCSDTVWDRLYPILEKLKVPLREYNSFAEKDLKGALTRDKKAEGGYINAVFAPGIGQFEFKKLTADEIVSLYERRRGI